MGKPRLIGVLRENIHGKACLILFALGGGGGLGCAASIMQALRDCQAFLFDMDGLLLDTERLARDALHAAAREHGVALPADIFLGFIGRRLPDIHRLLAAHLNGDEALSARLLDSSEAHYALRLAHGVPVKDGARELLDWLAGAGRPLGVATSTRTAKAERKLELAGLRDFFRTVVGGDQVEHGKPAPDIYLRAAAALGVPAAACGVFEDSGPGLQAAHAAGARVVWIPDLAPVPPAAQALALGRMDSLRELLALLRAPAAGGKQH